MNDTKPKPTLYFLPLIIALYLLIGPAQAAPRAAEKPAELVDVKNTGSLSISEKTPNKIVIRKAKVYHNNEGLKDEINIEGHLRELNAISKTKEESVEELIEHISIWIPKMYRERFHVNPRCIIILESKINEEEKAEIRFGVAMKCITKSQPPEIIHI